MNHVITFKEVIKRSAGNKKCHLLLGNDSDNNQNFIAKSNALVSRRTRGAPLNVTFYDAGSANVWG